MLLLSLLAGCSGDGVSSGGVAGELGHGKFHYACVDDSDPTCPKSAVPGSFPGRVGIGGLFDVTFEEFNADGASRVRLASAAPFIIAEQSQHFHAETRGFAALLARRTSDGRIIDFVHVEAVTVSRLGVTSNGAPPPLVWKTGQRQVLTATAQDSVRGTLAGARGFTWSLGGSDLVRLERANPAAEMEFFPSAPGNVTITVATGDVHADLQIRVEGKPVLVPPPPSMDAGATPDASLPGIGDGGSPPRDAARDAAGPGAADAAEAGSGSPSDGGAG